VKYHKITEKIIGCAYQVHNQIGFGFLESVYEKCMLIEMKNAGLKAVNQQPVKVFYDGEIVGDFIADIIVEDQIILELKSVRHIAAVHEQQLVNYLTATHKDIGLIINFGEKKVEIKRKFRALPDRTDLNMTSEKGK